MHLELNGSEYKVSAEGMMIELLPKEFALLQFLYHNRGVPSAGSSFWIKYGRWSIRWNGQWMIISTGCAKSSADLKDLISRRYGALVIVWQCRDWAV